jgi:hypothetical protein
MLDCPQGLSTRIDEVTREEKITAAQNELRKHSLATYVDSPPSIADGCTGVVVPGCPCCEKRLNTISQLIEHLAVDVVPAFFDEDFGMREPGME